MLAQNQRDINGTGEKPRNKPMRYGQLIYSKGGKNGEKNCLFNKRCWESAQLHVKE